ncbi:MAG: Spy/CpxP family protein refolding chaperone [Candidatus Omnitrophota bacterium]
MKPAFKQFVFVLAIVVLAFAVLFVWWRQERFFSAYNRPFGPRPPEHFEDMMARDLGLTPAQQQRLESSRKLRMQEARQLHNILFSVQEALMTELQKPAVNMAEVERLHQEEKKISLEIEDHKFKGLLELREVLTEEQFIKLHQHMKDFERPPEEPPFHEGARP